MLFFYYNCFLRLVLSSAEYISIAWHLRHARYSSVLSVILHVVHATENDVCTCETGSAP